MKQKWMTVAALFLAACVAVAAQNSTAEDYLRRYNLLVERVGLDGAGIENLLKKWEADYPEDGQLHEAKFVYYFSKSRTTQVIPLNQERYLGNAPVVSLKDSLGGMVHYFEDFVFDEQLYAQADAAIEKAIRLEPERIDLRLARISTLLAYEKESPDMALSSLNQLIDYNYVSKPKWKFSAEPVANDDFCAYIQDYCVTLFQIASPGSYEAFRQVSEKMSRYNPKEVLFLDNLGSWNMVVAKDSKTAQKYIDKALKLKPSDATAIRNGVLLARHAQNVKLEKKYLALMARYGETELDRQGAQARLSALSAAK